MQLRDPKHLKGPNTGEFYCSKNELDNDFCCALNPGLIFFFSNVVLHISVFGYERRLIS